MPPMNEYEEIGETLGRLLLKTGHPELTLFCLSITPIIAFIIIKFLFA